MKPLSALQFPEFKKLVKERNRLCFVLLLITAVAYFFVIVSIGFFPQFLALRIGDSAITLGIVFGLFVLFLCVILIGIYTYVANRFLDDSLKKALEKMKQQQII